MLLQKQWEKVNIFVGGKKILTKLVSKQSVYIKKMHLTGLSHYMIGLASADIQGCMACAHSCTKHCALPASWMSDEV